jgi:hypothetical protein
MATSVNISLYGDPTSSILPFSGSILPILGNTPFGWYDGDPQFQSDGPKFVTFASRRLGWTVTQLELTEFNFYQALEEAVATYAKELYEYKIQDNYISFEGTPTATELNNAVITPSLGTVIRISNTYGAEAGVGGNVPVYTASIQLQVGQQVYDLQYFASMSTGVSESIEIKKVFFEPPPAIVRFFDPYAGTGTGLQSLMQAFGFGQFSPGINFMLMPVNYDVQVMQAIEFNDTVRRSNYSFNIVNNQLTLSPVPTFATNMYFTFVKISERNNVIFSNDTGSVSNISNVPYGNITYSTINTPGKMWVFLYGSWLVQEILGRNREKYNNQVPIPGDLIGLNGSALIAQATQERDKMITQLRTLLDSVSRKNQLQRKADEGTSLRSTLDGVPIPIFVG